MYLAQITIMHIKTSYLTPCRGPPDQTSRPEEMESWDIVKWEVWGVRCEGEIKPADWTIKLWTILQQQQCPLPPPSHNTWWLVLLFISRPALKQTYNFATLCNFRVHGRLPNKNVTMTREHGGRNKELLTWLDLDLVRSSHEKLSNNNSQLTAGENH